VVQRAGGAPGEVILQRPTPARFDVIGQCRAYPKIIVGAVSARDRRLLGLKARRQALKSDGSFLIELLRTSFIMAIV